MGDSAGIQENTRVGRQEGSLLNGYNHFCLEKLHTYVCVKFQQAKSITYEMSIRSYLNTYPGDSILIIYKTMCVKSVFVIRCAIFMYSVKGMNN